MLSELIHNGVVVPEPPPAIGLVIAVRGEERTLSPAQEEMVLAWARKQGTPYVEDRTFVRNFLADFSQALGLNSPLQPSEVDFGPAVRVIEAERRAKTSRTADERKSMAAARKSQREALKALYGHAIVSGERVELGNYVVEPGGIFMGRGRHPLRGRWKAAARHEDITLNLSPDAPRPLGAWAEIIWQPESLWVARWQDRLSGKMKYVWLSDTAPIKQAREARKFDRAHGLNARLADVRARIEADLSSGDGIRRTLATACYLIDALCLRVGDEKDPDEADTVGATTLRPEHVTLDGNGGAQFRFLGKDSIQWHKQLTLPEAVHRNLEELIQKARPSTSSPNSDRSHPTRDLPQIFPDIDSRDVNAYLDGILPGLTAKVFRTHHATVAVQTSLDGSGVGAGEPDYRKWEAASLANLEAAMLCNHTRKAPAGWSQTRERLRERQRKAEERLRVCRERLGQQREALAELRAQAREKLDSAPAGKRTRLKERYRERIHVAKNRLDRLEAQTEAARLALGRIKCEASVAGKKRTWNLGTSLKSYIDPRVYHSWGQQVQYDVLERYYPGALQRKFAWARDEGRPPMAEKSVSEREAAARASVMEAGAGQ